MRTGLRRALVAGEITIVVLGLLLVVTWLWLNQDTSTYADGFSESDFSQMTWRTTQRAADRGRTDPRPAAIPTADRFRSWLRHRATAALSAGMYMDP